MGAITTYATLKTELTTYLARSDLSAQIDNFIDFAESEFNRTLRLPQMEEETTLTCDANGDATLPIDFLAARSARRVGSPNIELSPISMGGENRLSPYDTAGVARFYSISGTTFRVTPIEAASVVLSYYEKIPALDDTTTTNWLLTLAPDAYYYLAIAHYHIFAREFGVADGFRAMAQTITSQLEILGNHARYHNAGIVYDGPVD